MSYPVIKSILVLVMLATTLAVFGRRIYQKLWINLRRGQPGEAFGQWGERIKGLLIFVAGQLRLFRFLIPGTSHFFIFWGFVILLPTIAQAIVDGLLAFAAPNFALPLLGSLGPLAFLQDLFAVFVTISMGYALYLRLWVNPERYKGSHKSQGVVVLSFILTIMLSLLVMNGIRIQLGEDALSTWRPVSRLVGSLFTGLGEETQRVIGEAAYWVHLIVVLLFLTELPEGKHFHVITSLPAVFLRDLQPVGRLAPAPEFVDAHKETKPGVYAIEHFRWRQMLDFYTCTECGRCQDVCPAYASGAPLSPKLLIMGLRDQLVAQGAASNGNGALLGERIPGVNLWACTTCSACDQECPLLIQHIQPIVDMRRALVFDARMDNLLQEALVNLGRYGNSFGQSERGRARWTQPIQPKIKDARKEPVEYLWFVGDYASYSATLSEITRKTAEVFRKAGLDFGILYEAERNAGNDVRRVGEEALFEMLVEQNLAALERCEFRAIVTTDPHSYNTLKNEYPNEGSFPVLHYTELLDQLIASGQLKLNQKLGYTVTYHDPCYLGRYNNVYDAPRRVIAATGCKLVEMPRHGDRALCCGAGGGGIWMEEQEMKERPSEARVREAAALDGVKTLVVTCPKDVTMYKDAVKTTGLEHSQDVKDLIELVSEAI
ncbi:MAG: (Fe-S)-binding protein [Chloroflexota bacterium]